MVLYNYQENEHIISILIKKMDCFGVVFTTLHFIRTLYAEVFVPVKLFQSSVINTPTY